MTNLTNAGEAVQDILVVEDSETQAHRLARLLEDAGFRVRTAANGELGLAMARESTPTLVVSDIAMPVMDGFAMCSQMKKDPVLREVPVILLTALNSLHDVIRGLDCGADNFIRKPFDGQYLIGRIRFILANRKYRNEERVQLGMKINLGGQTHFINAERQQIFDLLISTYEEAVRMTEQLREQQYQIAHSYQSLEGLYRIAEALNPALSEREVASMALDGMMDLPDMVGGAILLYDGARQLQLVAASGFTPDPAAFQGCPGCDCRTVAAAEGQVASSRRPRCSPLFGQPRAGESATHISVPLVVGSNTFGVMNLVDTGERELSKDDCQVLDTAGKQIAVALERARLYAHMESLVEERTVDLQAERNLLSAVVNTSGALVFLVDTEGRVVMFNAACERSLGWKFEEVRGRKFWDVFVNPDTARVREMFEKRRLDLLPAQAESRWHARDGSVRRVLWSTTPIRRDDNSIEYMLGTGLDVTELEGAKEKVQYLSHFDALTGLPNRMLLRERYRQLRQDAASGRALVGLLMVRCERLPLIRESLGVTVEQGLLLKMTERLREWKHAEDSLARFDDLSFAVVAVRQGVHELSALARELVQLLDIPFDVEGQELHPEVSVGVAVAPTDGDEFEPLIQAVQAAARRAAANKTERFAFYRPELSQGANERFRMESALRHALDRGELLVHYQPQLDLRSGKIIGVEALVRWRHPELGIVPPASFISLAEETGMILQIGAWVLRESCRQVRAWRDQGLQPVPVAVNLSAKQFSERIVDTVKAVLADTGIEPHLLELELTESVSMEDPESTFRILAALKEMGVLLAIDDFGTGYSNLNYLKRFPVDKLKLDQSFVRELTSDPDDMAIARAVIAMAHGLRLRVIAEGVETDGQLAVLARMGCDEMQGYLFSRAVDADSIAQMLRDGVGLPMAKLSQRPYKRRLLFVDDDANVRAALRRITRNCDFEVHAAASANEAFELLATNEVSVILCDQRMPGMSGTEFLSRVKHMHPATVRMVLSGYTDLQSVTDAVNHGAIFKFLHKPWEEDELFEALEEAFVKYESNTRRLAQAQGANAA